MLTKQEQRWHSLRSFNIVIVCAINFFFIVGIGQSYTIFNSSPVFTAPLYIPITLLFLSMLMLHSIINKKDKLAQKIAPFATVLITLFVSINSHFQELTQANSFLYLVLILPLFYSYLLCYNTLHLIINTTLVVLCYIFASIIGETEPLVFLFNTAFLVSLCYLSIFTQLRASKSYKSPELQQQESVGLVSQQSGRYLNRIIHDIRQPLSSLSLHGSLLETKLLDTEHYKLASNIKQSSDELERWLSSLLDLARLEAHNVTPSISEFSLASVLLPIIKKYQHKAEKVGIKLTSRMPELSVKSDSRLLGEIIETLLSNALIHGSQERGAGVLLSVRRRENSAVIEVWNQGQQIEESIVNCLFDEVAQADNPLHNKSKGIGLGLPVAQRKAKLLGSEIEVETNHSGSRFSIKVETVAAVSQQPADLNKLSNHPIDYKILLIDDDQSILSALSMILENWGYFVDCADTAEAGLQKYQKQKYDLVISDYRLPNEQNGIEVIKQIKSEDNIPAVLLTGEADPGKLQEVQKTGEVIDYKILNKPVKPAALRFLLKQLLN